MGCLISKIVNNSANIEVLDYTPQDENCKYLRPRCQIIIQTDEKFKVLVIILDFDECVTKSVRLWPYKSVQKNQFLNLERTPLSSPVTSSGTNSGYSSGYDTVF